MCVVRAEGRTRTVRCRGRRRGGRQPRHPDRDDPRSGPGCGTARPRGRRRGLRCAPAHGRRVDRGRGRRVPSSARRWDRAHDPRPDPHVPRSRRSVERRAFLGADHGDPAVSGMAVLPGRGARGPARFDDDGHLDRGRRLGRLRAQRCGGAVRLARSLLRYRGGDRDAGPRRQDARGARADGGRRRLASAARARRDRGQDPDGGRRAYDPDRRASAGHAGRGPAGREDPGRRRDPGGSLVGGPVPADRGVGAGRRRRRGRRRRCLDQRTRPHRGLRHDRRGEHDAYPASSGCCRRRRARRRRCNGWRIASPPCSCRSCWRSRRRRSSAGWSGRMWRRARPCCTRQRCS